MYLVKSKNQRLNTYINSFIGLYYRPKRMILWRLAILCLLILIGLGKDYQNYNFSFNYWFAWTPCLIAILWLLTINFQSSCLGSMSYQYRHHVIPLQIAKNFPQFKYSPLINGLERKINRNKRACYHSYLILMFLSIGLFALIQGKSFFWQITFANATKYLAPSIYTFLVFVLLSLAITGSMLIVVRKRKIELMELALFWIESAFNLRDIHHSLS